MTTTTTIRLTTRSDHRKFAHCLAFRHPFKTRGNLMGSPDKSARTGMFGATGNLPDDWAQTYRARSGVIDYVVWSYSTPIAWHDKESGWIVPIARYSVTTSKHQSKIRAAISILGGYSE